MSLLEIIRHYTCGIRFNQVHRVLARWEQYPKVTEWGYYWEGGYFLEILFNEKIRYVHLRGHRHSAQPWENDAWVFVDWEPTYWADDDEYPWQSYFVGRTE